MDTLHWLGPLAVLALLLGCPVEPPYTDDDGGDDDGGDDDAADDDGGDDDGEDDDGGDDDGGDDDGGDDDSAPDQIDGYVTMSYYRTYNGLGGTMEGAILSASFYDVISEPSGMLQYAWPTGVDQCAITLYDYDDITGGTPGVYDYLSAGTLTVERNSVVFQLPYTNLGNGYWGYQLVLTPGDEMSFDAVYDVSAGGDEFPGFNAPGALEVPAPLQLISPSITGNFHATGDLPVSWSGGDPGSLFLYVTLASVSMEYAWIACEVANDGAFIIPASLLFQAPDGSGSLTLSQSTWTDVEAGGRWISVSGILSLTAMGTKP